MRQKSSLLVLLGILSAQHWGPTQDRGLSEQSARVARTGILVTQAIQINENQELQLSSQQELEKQAGGQQSQDGGVSPEQSDAVLAQSVADAAVVMSKSGGGNLSSTDASELVGQSNFQEFVESISEGDFDDENFLIGYNHDTNNQDDDHRYLKVQFSKFAEQAWDDKGNMIKDQKVLSKSGSRKFAHTVLANWKKFSNEENESYLQQNFDDIWNKCSKTGSAETGYLNLDQAEKFISDLI